MPHDALTAVGYPGRVRHLSAKVWEACYELAELYSRGLGAPQPAGREYAWRVLAACTGMPWPPEDHALGEAAARLSLCHWSPMMRPMPAVNAFTGRGMTIGRDDVGPGEESDEQIEWLFRWWVGLVVSDPARDWSAAVRAWDTDR